MHELTEWQNMVIKTALYDAYERIFNSNPDYDRVDYYTAVIEYAMTKVEELTDEDFDYERLG